MMYSFIESLLGGTGQPTLVKAILSPTRSNGTSEKTSLQQQPAPDGGQVALAVQVAVAEKCVVTFSEVLALVATAAGIRMEIGAAVPTAVRAVTANQLQAMAILSPCQ